MSSKKKKFKIENNRIQIIPLILNQTALLQSKLLKKRPTIIINQNNKHDLELHIITLIKT